MRVLLEGEVVEEHETLVIVKMDIGFGEPIVQALKTKIIQPDNVRLALAAMLGAYTDQAVTPSQRIAEKLARKALGHPKVATI